MSIIRVMLIFVALLSSVIAEADDQIFVFPLGDLNWAYTDAEIGNYGGSAVCSIALSQLPESISRAYIQVFGEAVPGELGCAGEGPWPLLIGVTIEDRAGDRIWSGERGVGVDWSSSPVGAFIDVLGPYEEFLEYLRTGSLAVTFFGRSASTDCQQIVTHPTGTLESATIWIEGNYPVASVTTEWGAVKALYR